MKKILSLNALLAGIVVFFFSFARPFERAIQRAMSTSALTDPRKFFESNWSTDYAVLTFLGLLLIAAGVIGLVRFRSVAGKSEPFSPVLISSGCALSVLALLNMMDNIMDIRQVLWASSLNSIVSSGISGRLEVSYNRLWLLYGCVFVLGLLALGIVAIAAGILLYYRERRIEKRAAAEADERHVAEPEPEPEPVEEIVELPQQEEDITLYCTVVDIRGDYALVKYDDTGIESEVALALLPFGIDVGDKLKFENYEFTQM